MKCIGLWVSMFILLFGQNEVYAGRNRGKRSHHGSNRGVLRSQDSQEQKEERFLTVHKHKGCVERVRESGCLRSICSCGAFSFWSRLFRPKVYKRALQGHLIATIEQAKKSETQQSSLALEYQKNSGIFQQKWEELQEKYYDLKKEYDSMSATQRLYNITREAVADRLQDRAKLFLEIDAKKAELRDVSLEVAGKRKELEMLNQSIEDIYAVIKSDKEYRARCETELRVEIAKKRVESRSQRGHSFSADPESVWGSPLNLRYSPEPPLSGSVPLLPRKERPRARISSFSLGDAALQSDDSAERSLRQPYPLPERVGENQALQGSVVASIIASGSNQRSKK